MRAMLLVLAAAVTVQPAEASEPVVASGGGLTRSADNRNAFTLPAPSLGPEELRRFNFGNRLFNTNWVVAPASVEAFDGLGPTFNRVSCSGCHLRDGRGRPPLEGESEMLSMLVRVSIPGADAHGGPLPHPAYGDQINDRAIPGVAPEARIVVSYREIPGRYPDGSPYSLRMPEYVVADAAFGGLEPQVRLSPRVAPHVVGMGLIEAVAEADIVAREDPRDRDGDGISGRANRVWNPVTQRTELGRYGWKANTASLLQQSAGAALGDIGLTSRWFARQNCPPLQTACAAAPAGGEFELGEDYLQRLVFYLQTLAVPAQRSAEANSRAGQKVFDESGCGACHVPTLRTAADAEPALLANQTFAPYSDFLLHDLGEKLADGRDDFLASGQEWRTAPLWGLGLVPTVNGHSLYLHDGRARNLEEAILWHGGEAESARQRFVERSRSEREALLAFLRSL